MPKGTKQGKGKGAQPTPKAGPGTLAPLAAGKGRVTQTRPSGKKVKK